MEWDLERRKQERVNDDELSSTPSLKTGGGEVGDFEKT